jgi:hypothetical protein
MKKLFYRLWSSRSFGRLFSVLAVAIVAFAVATKAQADCNPFWEDCSGEGGSSWFGSDFSAVIKLGDYNIDIVSPSSVCGPGFIDTVGNSNTPQGQTTECTLIENGVETLAQCQFSNLVCSCFKVPSGPLASPPTSCTGATITSTMTCPTNDPITKLNEAGCTGTITVLDLNGNPLPSHPNPINVGTGLSDLTNPGVCGQQFPAPTSGTGLPKNIMGTLTQECTTLSAQQQIVRSTNGFEQTTQWFNPLQTATCNPENGFPTNACSNDSGVNMTFALANGDKCVASNFSGGQFPDGSFGPHPSKCTFDKKSGLCQCRFDRCTPQGSLVNPGIGDQGLFVANSADNVYACQVNVVH